MSGILKRTIKTTYKLLPFKQKMFTAIKAVCTLSEPVYRHLHFKGVFKVKVNDSSSFKIRHYGFQIENTIFWEGLTDGWEKESMKVWIKLCEKAEVVIDIGANTGVYALIAKAANKNSKVYAFEPVKRVFEKLQANIELNKYDIIAIEKATSNSNGVAVIYDNDNEHTYSVAVNKNMAEKGAKVNEIKIETITLDTFVEEYKLEKIDLIKIDVETHEPEVLEGFKKYIEKFKPTILIEILEDEVGSRVQNLIKDLGYIYFNIDENKSIRKVDTITKSDYYNYLICTPKVADELGLL